MDCFICNKSTSEKRVGKKITEYCDSCNFHKTKDTQKFSESYEEEFWINSDYSEFTGTDFTDKKVNDLVLTFASNSSLSGLELAFYSDNLLDIEVNDNDLRSDIYSATDMYNDIQKYVVFSMDNVAFENNMLELVKEDGAQLDIQDINVIAGSKDGVELSLLWDAAEVKAFTLDKMYPNPFNPTTQISYSIENAGQMKLSIYNIAGQEVSVLHDGYQSSGSYNVQWNAAELASGVYYVSMVMNGHVETMKAVVVK